MLREGPPTRRALASDTIPPLLRSTSCFSPLSTLPLPLHFILRSLPFRIHPGAVTSDPRYPVAHTWTIESQLLFVLPGPRAVFCSPFSCMPPPARHRTSLRRVK